MEAIEFLREAQRMCGEYACYDGCPIYGKCVFDGTKAQSSEQLEALVAAVEAWVETHPIKTNAQMFEEVFGKIELKDYIKCRMNHMSEDETEIEILEGKWWNEPYKEPEHED